MTRRRKVTSAVRVRVYDVVRRAVEDGTAFGWMRARKHTEAPTREDVLEAQVSAVMSELCDVLVMEPDDGQG